MARREPTGTPKPAAPGQPKSEVSLPAGARPKPYVDPRVPQDALGAAQAYEAGVSARRARHAPPKTTTPVGVVPQPPIPRLDGAPGREDMTMAQSAIAERAAAAHQPPVQEEAPASFVERPAPQQAPPRAGPPTPRQLGIMPMDILPEQAKSDPAFRDGHGAMFAQHQPELAAKYGVVRNGHVIAPQQLLQNAASGKPQLSQKTVEGLEELARFQHQGAPEGMPETEEQAEGQVSDAARAAGRVGNLPGDDSEEPLSKEEQEEVRKAVQNMDEYQFDAWRQAVMKDMLNNPEQKEIIEARLEPMDLGDLVTSGFIIQKVPIVPGKFEASFRVYDGETDLALKRLIMEDSKSLEVSDRYYLDKFSLMGVAATTYAINGKVLPDYRSENGNFDDEKFYKKFNLLLRLPLHMLASLGVNAMWFDMRVRKLFVAENVGNG